MKRKQPKEEGLTETLLSSIHVTRLTLSSAMCAARHCELMVRTDMTPPAEARESMSFESKDSGYC